ncbi:MAG: AMP-binding protein [Myxococcota bacterium]
MLEPAMGLHVGAMLRQNALRRPEAVALTVPGREVSYAELDRAACRAGAALARRGVRPGDRVALVAGNGTDFVASWFGILYAGAAVVPVPILSAAPELAFRLNHARCVALVHDRARADLAADALRQASAGVAGVDAASLVGPGPALPGLLDAPGDLAMVLYTSGTTGSPKGAAIGHGSLVAHTAALVQHTLRLGPRDVVLGVLPLTHSFGIRMAVLAPFFAGGRVVLAPHFDAAESLAWAAAEAVTWLPGVPTMFRRWSEVPGAPWSALRWCLSAGAPLPEVLRERAERRLGAEVRQGYGLTEATFSCIDAPPDPAAPHTSGRPVWGVEVRLEGHREPGESGEVLVRGQNLMLGYLGDPEATDAVLQDGWLRTGDIGVFDGEGRLRIVDRLKDVILRGGANVYPSEVEEALQGHPDVRALAVVGRADEDLGEEVVAVVVPRAPLPSAEATRAFAASLDAFARRRIARNKVPRELAIVDALPLGPSGKVLKRTLRARLASGALRTVPVAAPVA